MSKRVKHQTVVELVGGPCCGERIDVGTHDDLPNHLERLTPGWCHWYSLENRGGVWVYEHLCFDVRRCGK